MSVRTKSVYSVRSSINQSTPDNNKNRTANLSALRFVIKKSFLFGERLSHLAVVVEILMVYNCRVGEVLKARWDNYYPGRYLVLQAEKKSRAVIVRDREILSAILKLKRTDNEFIFSSVNYHTVYNFLKRNYSHLFAQFKTAKNYKVTHGFRYSNVSQLHDVETAKAVLHHNSKKSCLYYNKNLIEDQNLVPVLPINSKTKTRR